MKKTLLIILIIIPLLGIIYYAGPRPLRPKYPKNFPVLGDSSDVDTYVRSLDAGHKIKPGNGSEIVWNDPEGKGKTGYAVVYLHGFSASKEEGNPVHKDLAKKLHANLFLPRLADHGIDTIAPLQYFTADRLWESGKQALAVGEKLGKKVLLVGTSTGGSLALQLAAAYPDKVKGLILLSPNIKINDNTAFLANDPWGLQIARKVIGGDERVLGGKSALYSQYWNTHYRLEAVVQLEELVETTMTNRTFNAVKQPLLLLYYYKNEKEQDPVVRVDAMLEMFDALGTPAGKKFKQAIPGAGNHVIGSYITGKDLPAVEKAINGFIEKAKL